MKGNPILDLSSQLEALVKGLLILAFLVGVDATLLHSEPSLNIREVAQTSSFSGPVRQVGETPLLFHPVLGPGGKRLLTEQLQGEYELIEYRPTWPEYGGYALAGLFCLGCFWFLFAVACEEWTAERAAFVVKGRLWAFAALYFTYAVAAAVGWVWLPVLPFLVMGVVLLAFGALLERIRSLPKARSSRSIR